MIVGIGSGGRMAIIDKDERGELIEFSFGGILRCSMT
jgi:hypothetical protein